MIKKTTKVVFKDGGTDTTEEMIGGMPLSKGEFINVHKDGKVLVYEVADKTVDCYFENNDQHVNITYTIKRNN
ncbi:MAG: hypothetical protein WC544_00950 [Patescibacteria group bacterium]